MSLRVSFPDRSRLTKRASRRGFTLPEILIVIVMISLISLVAIPRFANITARRHMDSARMRVASGLATARQAAIQKGRTVRFKIDNNRVTVTVGVPDTNLISPAPLYTLYKVSTDNVTIDYSGRGFAVLAPADPIRLTRENTPNDSVIVTKTGMVQR